MGINSISVGMVSFTLPAFKSAVQLKAPQKGADSVVVPAKVQEDPSMVPGTATLSAPVSMANKSTATVVNRVSES